MPVVWDQVLAEDLGIPSFPREGCADLRGKPLVWLNGVDVSVADWYLVEWSPYHIRRYQEAGGDMTKLVVHFFSYDGAFEALYGADSFHKRVTKMNELGVKRVIAPEFSTSFDMPMAHRIFAIYRGAVVARDLVRAGFEVIPFPWPGGSRNMWSTSQSVFPADSPLVALDAGHLGRRMNGGEIFKRYLEYFRRQLDYFKSARFWVYTGARDTAEAVNAAADGRDVRFIVSAGVVLGKLGQAAKRIRREAEV